MISFETCLCVIFPALAAHSHSQGVNSQGVSCTTSWTSASSLFPVFDYWTNWL